MIYPEMAFAQDGSGPGGLTALLINLSPFILILIIFYFLLIRPQQKKERERQQMLSRISKGDVVVTSGGLIGTVVGVKDPIVVLRISENVKVEILKNAITQVREGKGEIKEE